MKSNGYLFGLAHKTKQHIRSASSQYQNITNYNVCVN